jgi:eukaryotic-like serine/threonine-protein kinase
VKVCPACAQANDKAADFCIRCGFSLANVTADATGAFPGPPLSSPAGPLSRGGLPAGFVVDGKYSITRVLGEGGMGIVYLARDVHTDTPVVVKSIRAEFADNPEFRTRILAEGRALARIDHPNVVRLNALVVEPASLYLIMQFIDGEPLDRIIQRSRESRTPIPLAEALRVFRMILEGVGAAHKEGVIHRDLKPANILVRAKDGMAKVTDFGIAKWEDDAKAGRGLTKGIIGSIYYMAPEQIRGQRDLDKRVDIYALGVLMFELLTGRLPFDAPSDYEIMKLHAEAPMPSLLPLRPDVPPFLDEVIRRACAKDRSHRYESAEQFLAALDHPTPVAGTVRFEQPPASLAPAHAPSHAPSPRTEPLPLAMAAHSGPMAAHSVPPPEQKGPTGGGSALTTETTPLKRSILPWIGLGVIVIAGGGAGAYLLASGDTSGPGPTPSATRDAPSVQASAPPVKSVTEPKTPPSPLAQLVGHWTSDTRRDYEAVLAGDAVEFRIVHAAQFPRQGYEDGEVRFRLSLMPGKERQFAVEDHLRPTPPTGLEYESIARDSCRAVWTQASGKRLVADFDGERTIAVDLVQVRTSTDKFVPQGKKIVRCVNIDSSPTQAIESKLTRTPG